MIKKRLLNMLKRHTACGMLEWSCGSHSDIWSAKHAYYEIKVNDGIFRHDLEFWMNGRAKVVTIWFWQFNQILNVRPRVPLTYEELLECNS